MVTEFEKCMPADTIYITIIRHPASQFESMYKYYKFSDRFHTSIIKFASNPSKFYRRSHLRTQRRRQSGVNPMLFDLGLRKEYLQDNIRIKRQIKLIDENFGLVLISEFFDQSLILLKDLLCWRLEDVAYFVVNARKESQVVQLSDEVKSNLTRWNEGDLLLYQHFNKTLWKKIYNYGYEKLQTEVEELRDIMASYKDLCLDKSSKRFEHGGKTLVVNYRAKSVSASASDDSLCKSLTYKPLVYLSKLRKKMKFMSN